MARFGLPLDTGLGHLRNGQMASPGGLPMDYPATESSGVVEDDNRAIWLCHRLRTDNDPGRRNCGNGLPGLGTKVGLRVFGCQSTVSGGRPRSAGYFRRAVKASDGRIWFADSKCGRRRRSPLICPENRIAPPVKIEAIAAGTGQLSPGSLVAAASR